MQLRIQAICRIQSRSPLPSWIEHKGQELLDEALEAKAGVQQALNEKDFQNAPIVAEVMEAEVVDDTCDLCYGNGLLICDGCNGTTYLDGNQWTVCGKCAGAGRTVCTLCNGAGSSTCDSCGGAGRLGGLPCPRCGGTLWAMCYRCNGSGKNAH